MSIQRHESYDDAAPRGAAPLATFELLATIQRFARTHRRIWDAQLRKSIPGMSAKRAEIILQLGKSGGASQIRLAHLLGLSQMTVSRLLDELEGLGLAEREAVPADRRAWAVRLTMSGRDALIAIHGARRAFVERSAAAIDEADRANFVALLNRLEAAQR